MSMLKLADLEHLVTLINLSPTLAFNIKKGTKSVHVGSYKNTQQTLLNIPDCENVL